MKISRTQSVVTTFAVATGLMATSAFATTYKLDASHSSANFSVRHLVSKVTGSFKEIDGEFNFDEKAPEKTTGKFTAKADSIDTQNSKRDDHLKSEDFFDAKKFPTLTVEIKKFTKAGKKFKAVTDFTMHGVTKPVTFDVDYGGTAEFMGQHRAGFTATGVVNRKDFGINWNKALDKGGMVLGDEVNLTLNVEAMEAKGDAKADAKAEKAPAKEEAKENKH